MSKMLTRSGGAADTLPRGRDRSRTGATSHRTWRTLVMQRPPRRPRPFPRALPRRSPVATGGYRGAVRRRDAVPQTGGSGERLHAGRAAG